MAAKPERVERILLIGPTGAGKTTAARHIAELLGWQALDTDALVERAAGTSVAAIFADEGEAAFRQREHAALASALAERRVVVATGGGIGERGANRELMRSHGWVVSLAVAPETSWRRVVAAAAADGAASVGAVRPMLVGDDPQDRLRALALRRQPWYADADETIVADDLDADTLARRVVAGLVARGLLPTDSAEPQTAHVSVGHAGAGYDAVVAWGALAGLGARLTALRLPSRLFVVADANVAALYEPPLLAGLLDAGFQPHVFRVPAGEASKSREQLNAIHDWLAERRAERSEAVMALGGGVVGDLAGFAAATYLRGLPLIQIPTSLLAQVDASIGGKVAIDHPRGKNLIGAFYQPRLVLTDPAALLTMPPRQRTEGWAEVIKHGVALDAAYFETLEREADALAALHPMESTAAIARSVAIKAGVVAGDEREQEGGQRALLNYGHTLGHAIETVTGYGAWLHGEAVAVGMAFAARLGARIGVTPGDLVARQDALLTRMGLPTRADGISARDLLRATLWDKKARGGQVRWVLPTALGAATLVADVPEDAVRAILLEVGAADDL
ncbi:MAG: 3-dehydroquinate synthase [Ktedonobacterales bacterium]